MNTSNRNAPRFSTYAEALDLIGGRDSVKIGHNTYLERLENGTLGVRLHRTYIVKFNASGSVELFTGGWRTITTKERMNRYLPAGHSVYQRANVWRITGPDGVEQDFQEGIMIVQRAVTA